MKYLDITKSNNLNKYRTKLNKRVQRNKYQCHEGYVSAISTIYRKELTQKATEAELVVKQFLEDWGVRHQFQKTFIKPFHRIADFYIPKKKIIIEVDGGYHQTTQRKDKIKDELWEKRRGCRTIRITNEQVFSGDFQKVLFLELCCG
jgi:ATP-dependent DNA helicase RecG